MPANPTQAARRGLALAALALLLSVAEGAGAGNFSVSPVRAELSIQQRVAALRVHNGGSEPVAIQAEAMAWQQRDNEDVLTPSREVLVTPPIFTIPPGETQTLRIGLRRSPDPNQQLSYRLLLHELPPPLPEGFQGLRMAMRMSLPVFVTPAAGAASPELAWRASLTDAGDVRLSARNHGTGHAQITTLTLGRDNGQQIGQQGNHYLLPGSERHWTVPVGADPLAPGEPLTLEAMVNGKELRTRLRPD